MKRSKLACVLIAFSLLAVACGSDEESAPSTLKIGYAADFSDLGGFADMPASQAANHFVALVNCSGGIASTSLPRVRCYPPNHPKSRSVQLW